MDSKSQAKPHKNFSVGVQKRKWVCGENADWWGRDEKARTNERAASASGLRNKIVMQETIACVVGCYIGLGFLHV